MSMRKSFSRRNFLKSAMLGAGGMILTACSTQASPTTAQQPAESTAAAVEATATKETAKATVEATATTAAEAAPTAAAQTFTAGVTPGSPAHARGWVTNMPPAPSGMPFNPPLTVTSARNATNLHFAKNDTIEDNPFTRLIKEQLGIEWKTAFSWSTPDELSSKYNLAMVSGELPDFMEGVPVTIFNQMLEADMVEDITDVFEREASERVKKNFGWGDGIAWKLVTIDGRKMALPFMENIAQNDKILWIRKDWLEKVGMEPPKTMEELGKVAKAFIDNNLGQGAAGTTVGLLACREFNVWYASLDPVFGAFGAIPVTYGGFYWQKMADGTLAHGGIQPGIKEALSLLQQWYKDGIIPTDFDTKEAWQQQQLVAGNQCGLHFSPFFGATYGGSDSIRNDPSAQWTFADIPAGPSGKRGKSFTSPVNQGLVYAFKKGSPHVAAIIQQINWMAEWFEQGAAFNNRFHGWEDYNYQWTADDKIETIQGVSFAQQWAYGPIGNSANTGTDPYKFFNEAKTVDEWSKLDPAKMDAAQEQAVVDPDGMNTLQRQAYMKLAEVSEEQGIRNEFFGQPTPTMKELQADLVAMELEMLFGVIKGNLPIDAFDTFVENWKANGGDQITEEVNQWYAAQA